MSRPANPAHNRPANRAEWLDQLYDRPLVARAPMIDPQDDPGTEPCRECGEDRHPWDDRCLGCEGRIPPQ